MTDVSGYAAAGFERVREVFAAGPRHCARVARLCALLAGGGALDGKRLLSESAVMSMLEVQRDPFGGFGMGGLGGHLGMGQRAHRMGFGYVRSRLAQDDAAGELLVAVAKSVALLG